MASNRSGQTSAVRIIGGNWRGRKLLFRSSEGLRPTVDRVRETLFNWLVGEVSGAHCLDLFSGSGALGLEALSRGAASCLMLDKSRQNCANINTHLQTLAASNGHCLQADAREFLQRGRSEHAPMDIVFLDPPFDQGLLGPVSATLEQRDWLAGDARIYVEASRREPEPVLPGNWQLHRGKTAGEVRYQLFVRLS
ncbi:MAG: 16S rRNA (guanine(966)-N(2))-methyltransferase RsmD [Gammaproteobacteria bacterium]|nr:16S rRNA (guanine(966)-N(2))-methyltransferase RsmD [Gammaproteobacteria bacterium]